MITNLTRDKSHTHMRKSSNDKAESKESCLVHTSGSKFEQLCDLGGPHFPDPLHQEMRVMCWMTAEDLPALKSCKAAFAWELNNSTQVSYTRVFRIQKRKS